MKYSGILLSLSLIFILSSCGVTKGLEEEVGAKINETINLKIVNTSNTKFSSSKSEADMKNFYLTSMKNSLKANNVNSESSSAKYEISIEEVIITETTANKTITDSSSKDLGKVFELTTIKITTKGTVKRISDGATASWSAYKDKSEKVTSLRNAEQMVNGENKNLDEYREKEFVSHTCADMMGSLGGKASTEIIRQIKKMEKP